ncbi:MAG TPA: hypothetical protein DCL77_18175 [Prolixibacteraceae bacterium]|jgi:beta-glucanase (GH16 family)|nr:hypothetical protein [Prolixibacteraceae bacterium]
MKGFALTVFWILFIISEGYAQTYNRHSDPKYMWTSLDENFNGSSINPKLWKPTTRFKRQLGFLIDSPKTIRVKKGNLWLTMRNAHAYLDSLWSSKGWKRDNPKYVGGEIVSMNKYCYGVFECRAKYARKSGSWPAFWLIGNDGLPCPLGPHGSEIDIAEMSSAGDFPTMMHVIHRYYPTGNCAVSNQVAKDRKSYQVSAIRAYSTYKCIWTPDKIQFFINDKLKHEVINHNYEWFPSFPLTLILSQQITQGQDAEGLLNPVTPQTSKFDWVKVRQFFLAPEITCPDVIPSEGAALLDVDPLASHITWKLTPAERFSTSEGTGKSAPIIRANNTNGQGKITYTFQMPSGETFTAEKTFN